ncbi:MAG: hypothetical protein KJ070_14960 [Verrucomicrobia bacterium]|nr:hypothetical protein [Verrucomicrobiota bacterium]
MKARLCMLSLLWLPLCLTVALSLPAPPQQNADWLAPADAPSNIVSAAKTLFAQGFPDPRGCEYREIEIVTSGVWDGRTNATATRGWVLPEATGEPRFAIAWNGLIYPVVKLGDAADLRAEIEGRESGRGTNFVLYSGIPDRAIGESRSVFLASASSTRVLLLLRLGETSTALKSFMPSHAFESRVVSRIVPLPGSNAPANDPYLQFAGDWAWALFDGVIGAHMRGDGSFALATARTLAGLQPKIEAEAARRGFPRLPNNDPRRKEKERPYLDFLDQFPQLLSDLERREREGPRVRALERGLTNFANPGERITALIRDLDLVAARQSSQPGWVIAAQDPIVAALIAEGDAAVEPLLDCVEADKRLTRSVGFGRDFFRSRTVLTVSSAANHALLAILQANFRSTAEMRAYWKKYGNLKIQDRWFEILKDDSAGMGRWLESAGLIVQPTNKWTLPGLGYGTEHPAPTDTPIPLRGEVLRERANPSVADLFARRALEISPTNLAAYDLSAAGEMGLRLAAWDADTALPVLKVLAERCRAVLEYSAPPPRSSALPWGPLLAKLSVARAENSDPAALADYAAWLKTTRPDELERSLADSLAPLFKFPTNAILRAVADDLFSNTNSTWGRLPWTRSGQFNPVESELIRVPAFRRLLARELENETICGVVEWRSPNWVSFTLTNQVSQNLGRTLALPDNEQPVAGGKAELRWCDWIAVSLAQAKQIPPFNPFAPVEARDAAIAEAQRALTQTEPL